MCYEARNVMHHAMSCKPKDSRQCSYALTILQCRLDASCSNAQTCNDKAILSLLQKSKPYLALKQNKTSTERLPNLRVVQG